jgi:hypothetical protein
MTEERPETAEPTASSEYLTALMRRALATPEDAPPPDVLGGVQQRLRERSGGKFYRDGWSTTRQPPVATYLVTSLLMLAIVAILYAILVPIAGAPLPTVPPRAVQVIPNP